MSRRRLYRRADLVLDAEAHEVRVRGKRVALTRQQIEILRALFEADGATLRRDQLLDRIGSLEGDTSGRSVDLHVSRLRRRLRDDPDVPKYIEAVYGVGYRLVPERNDPSDGRFAAAILAALPEAVLILDERVVVRDVNRAAEVLLGRGREDLIGLACGEAVGCRGCDGVSLAGAPCLGRAALRGEVVPDEVRGSVRGTEGRVPVTFAHVEVVPDVAVRLVALALRPGPDLPEASG